MVMRVVIGLLAVWIGLGASGCGGLASAGSMKVVSRGDEAASLSLDLPTRVCDAPDNASLEFFLTDLPPAVWKSGADVSDMSGVIVHIHMFIFPKAGRTPIEYTASTATVRVLVLARGELGVFGGGGFFTKSGSIGDAKLGGALHEATLRLIRATPGFDDRLGPGVASGGVSATNDPAQVRALRRVFNYLSSFATPLE
ncbi:MAG: hypothetical protein HBSAPP03_17810 [Phycisphaerae bacterium]|nr:MAG: hypothetical protein HBSAPP03_17810 [Phycisphaerae bacterium]